MAAIKTSQIKGQLAGILKKCTKARVIGLKTANKWQQEATVTFEKDSFFVTQCDSQLAIREAIVKAKSNGTGLVFVTGLDDLDLGSDLRTQLVKRKLIPIKPWESVKELFQARDIDVAVFKKPWLADVLISKSPANGYAVAANGFLTAERVWQEVLFHQLTFTSARPDAADIIEWSLDKKRISLLKEMEDSRFQDICEWIRQGSESLEVFLLQLLKSGVDFSLLALGLAFEVVTNESGKGNATLREAAIRLEKYTDHKQIQPRMLNQLKVASQRVYRKLAVTNKKGMISEVQERLDYLLGEIGVQDFIWLSSVSLKGFEQRLVRFAKMAGELLKKGNKSNFKELIEHLNHVENHWAAVKSPRRLDRMRMALRLLKWLTSCSDNGSSYESFAEAAKAYASEGGFIDRARDALRAGDECKELAGLYTKLIKKVEDIRGSRNLSFATLLQKWTEAGSQGDDLLKIEDLLEKVVAPIAKEHHLLLIVMDGMSHAVFSELKEDLIENDAWVELTHPVWAPPKPVIAALPTVTEVSRRSLLCGRLTDNPKDDEHKGFANHVQLRAASGMPPILFHKAGLSGDSGTDLAEAVRNEIHSARRKVVGVVLNNVDDFLYRGDQISFPWRIEDLHVLSQLLYEAREAERIVIITSDHGHVLDYHSKLYNCDFGERWRPDDGDIKEGEIVIQGQRVLKPASGRMIAPFSEHIRYGKKKNGYHGGVTPQEVIAPYAVMKWQHVEKGWEAVPFYQPQWWDISVKKEEMVVEISKPAPIKTKVVFDDGNLSLFPAQGKKETIPPTDWIEAFLQSKTLLNQKRLCGRAVLSDQMIRAFLKVITVHGGTILQPVLAKELGQPLVRMRGIISKMERICNVDGYLVFTFDTASNTATINIHLLKTQFKI